MAALIPLVAGCSSPSKANIELRKRNAALEHQVEAMKRKHEADEATIRGLQDRVGTVRTLPHDRLKKLFTVGSLKLGRLTGGFNLDHEKGADTGVRAYAQLYDTTGDLIKAAGSFEVQVFDLAESEHPLVAERFFPVEKADSLWYPMPLVYSFVLPVAWKIPPKHEDLLVRVTYTDELTRRVFTAEQRVHVKLSSAPSTRPAATSGPSGA